MRHQHQLPEVGQQLALQVGVGRHDALGDVPDDDLKSVISDFKSEGATVASILQDDGKWTVVATFFGKRVAAEDIERVAEQVLDLGDPALDTTARGQHVIASQAFQFGREYGRLVM